MVPPSAAKPTGPPHGCACRRRGSSRPVPVDKAAAGAGPMKRIGMAMHSVLDLKEIEMTTTTWHRIASAVAAAGFATALAGPALAQTAAHSHDAATPHALSLNHGHKWATDEALRQGMDRIRALVAPRLGDAHAGKLSATQYRELAAQVETEVARIVATCKLEPEADAMLHLVIADLGEGTAAMAGKNAKLPAAQGLVRVALAVNEYGGHFEHPGFKPIANLH